MDILKDSICFGHKYSMIMADWPFKIYKKLYEETIMHSTKIMKKGGNFISILYPEENYYIRKECERYGLTFGDEIVFKMKMTYNMHDKQLPKRTLSALLMVNGSIDDRIWYGPHTKHKRILNAESMDITTNEWFKTQFKNGFRRKHLNIKHKEAMPEWVVSNLLDLTVRKNDNVLDLFGGAGTVPNECARRDIECISTEIKKENCNIMKLRILNT